MLITLYLASQIGHKSDHKIKFTVDSKAQIAKRYKRDKKRDRHKFTCILNILYIGNVYMLLRAITHM